MPVIGEKVLNSKKYRTNNSMKISQIMFNRKSQLVQTF